MVPDEDTPLKDLVPKKTYQMDVRTYRKVSGWFLGQYQYHLSPFEYVQLGAWSRFEDADWKDNITNDPIFKNAYFGPDIH